MHRRVLGLSLVVAVGLAVLTPALAAPTAGTPAATTTPSLNLTVGSTQISEGDLYKTGRDPELTINASVGEAAPAERTLTEIVVRVNGDLQRNISVDGDAYSGTITLELETGKNKVRVIATDDKERANSTAFTVNKDDHAPYVQLTHPYWTAPYQSIRDGTTNGSWTLLNGTIFDDSEVRELYVLHQWESAEDNDDIIDYEDGYSLRNPDRNVSQQLFFGANGRNIVQFTATDRFGNTRIMEFEVRVNDTERPTLQVDPTPTRTAREEVFISGTVGDDVWVDRASVDVTFLDGDWEQSRHVFKPKTYTIEPQRTEKAFNKSFRLTQPGTYRVSVNARDHRNKSVNRTFKIERLPEEEFTIAPEIRIVRERTVVLDSETLFLDGIVFDGQTERVVVETRNATTGKSIGYHFVYSGDPKKRIDFDRRVTIAPGRTEVIVRAIDANGVEHERSFFVDGTSKETFVGNGSDDGLSVSLRTLRDGDSGIASASAKVTGAESRTTVTIPGDSADAVAETPAVSFRRLDVSLTADANFTVNVTTRDRRGGTLAAPSGTRAIATATIDHSISNERVDGTTLRFDVRTAYLEERGVDPSNVTAYRRVDGTWSRVETTRLADNGTHARYRLDSPGLSLYALVAPPADEPSEPDDETGTPTDDGQGDEESDGGVNGKCVEPATPRIFVSNVTLNATDVSPGSVVAVNATLTNSGDGDGTYVAALRVFEETNITLEGKTTVSVPAGGEVTRTLVHRFNETGTYNVSVNGTRAGPITVQGGGLLSIFSFVPVGLIGMGLAVLVGLAVVGVLVRFVLGRVGGGEASG